MTDHPIPAARGAQPPPGPGDNPPALRRPSARGGHFVARSGTTSPSGGAVLERNVLRSAANSKDRVTARRHEIAGDLPAWEPLPPGELRLRRPSAS